MAGAADSILNFFRHCGCQWTVMILLLTVQASWAQQLTVSGYVKDKADNYPLVDGTVVLLGLPDSNLVAEPAATDLNGRFVLTGVPKGNFILKILYVGYRDVIRPVALSDSSLTLGVIGMVSSTASDQVIVTAVARSFVQKGDTTQFNAEAFKTNPDATAEDLITKMPGVTVVDGKVQAQGENVTKVLVDGKPFFGDDPSTVLKNLPAEVIDKVQVFDQLSDQSQFTGFDDGNRSKTINIVTKPDKRDGNFGKVYAGYGDGDKYRAGMNINFFKGNRRISIIGQTNNINEQNFSADDLLGLSGSSGQGGGGGGRSGRGGGSGGSDNFLVNAQGGVSKTHAFGINYSDKWGEKLELTASYFFNRGDNFSDKNVYRRYVQTSDSVQTYDERTLSNSVNVNHRFNARLDYKIDSMNSLLIVPKFSYQQNDGERSLNGNTYRGPLLANNTSNGYHSNQYGLNASNMLLFRHKFVKRGRTLSLHLNTGYNQTSGANEFVAQNNFYTNTSLSDTLNQHSDLMKNGYNIEGKASYTEPLSEKSMLEFNYGVNYMQNTSDKRTYNFDAVSQQYNQQDTSLSNVFKSIYITHAGGAGYRYQSQKYQIGFNMSYQYAVLDNDQDFPKENSLNRSFSNLLPSARLKINFSKTKNIRMDYRTQTTSPSVDQLQNVINNSNPLQLSTGNPGLRQQYQHNLSMRYTATNSEKSSNFFTLLSASYIQDYVANSTYIANSDTTIAGVNMARGAQLSTKDNVDGYLSARSFVSFGQPIAFIKSNLNLNVSANYTRTPGLINGLINYANSPSFGAGLVLSSNISSTVDFTVSTNSSYNFVRNTLNKSSDAEFFNQSSRVKLNLIMAKHIVLNTEANHQYNAGLSAGYNQNYILWNAGLGYKFLKNNAAELRFTVFDLLGQNNSVNRTFTDIYNEDTRSNVLTRYYMVTFTYNFRNYRKADSSQ